MRLEKLAPSSNIVSNSFSTYNMYFCDRTGGSTMKNKIRISKKVATKASSQLRSKATTSATKSVAGSALNNRKK